MSRGRGCVEMKLMCVKPVSEKFIMYLLGVYLYMYEFFHIAVYYFSVIKLELMIMSRFPSPFHVGLLKVVLLCDCLSGTSMFVLC